MATNGSNGVGPFPPPSSLQYSSSVITNTTTSSGFNAQTHTVVGKQIQPMAAPPTTNGNSAQALAPNAPQALAPYAVPGRVLCGCGCGCSCGYGDSCGCGCGCGGTSNLYLNGQPYYPTNSVGTASGNPTHSMSGASAPTTPQALAPYASSRNPSCGCGKQTRIFQPGSRLSQQFYGCGCCPHDKNASISLKRLKPIRPSISQLKKLFLKPTVPGTQIVTQPFPQYSGSPQTAPRIDRRKSLGQKGTEILQSISTGTNDAACFSQQTFINAGGPILTNIQVIPICWGTKWDPKSPNVDSMHLDIRSRLPAFLEWFLKSSVMDIIIQNYSTSQYQIEYGTAILDSDGLPFTISDDSYFGPDGFSSSTLDKLLSKTWNAIIPPITNGQQFYLIFPQDGSTPNLCNNGIAGYHISSPTVSNLYYGVVAYADPATCSVDYLGASSIFDAITVSASHEICEAITDPAEQPAWYSPTLSAKEGTMWEIADACNCGNPSGVYLYGENDVEYFVQEIWCQPPGSVQGFCAYSPHSSLSNTSVVNAPAIAAIGDAIVLAWHSPGDEKLHVTSNLKWGGMIFDPPVDILDETAIDLPAISYGPGDKYYLAWSGRNNPSDHQINIRSTFDVANWQGSQKVVLPEWSNSGPALAYGNGILFLARSGTDNRINLRWSYDGTWSGNNKKILQQWALYAPGIAYFYPYLYLSFMGVNNGQIYVCRTKDYGQTLELLHTIPNEATAYTPNLTLTNNELILAWTGTDSPHTINSMRGDLNTMTFNNKEIYDQTASGAVTLASFQGGTFIGWSGNDAAHHLNIMELP